MHFRLASCWIHQRLETDAKQQLFFSRWSSLNPTFLLLFCCFVVVHTSFYKRRLWKTIMKGLSPFLVALVLMYVISLLVVLKNWKVFQSCLILDGWFVQSFFVKVVCMSIWGSFVLGSSSDNSNGRSRLPSLFLSLIIVVLACSHQSSVHLNYSYHVEVYHNVHWWS